MDDSEKRAIAEALILASQEPIPAARLASLIPRCTPAQRISILSQVQYER